MVDVCRVYVKYQTYNLEIYALIFGIQTYRVVCTSSLIYTRSSTTVSLLNSCRSELPVRISCICDIPGNTGYNTCIQLYTLIYSEIRFIPFIPLYTIYNTMYMEVCYANDPPDPTPNPPFTQLPTHTSRISSAIRVYE